MDSVVLKIIFLQRSIVIIAVIELVSNELDFTFDVCASQLTENMVDDYI